MWTFNYVFLASKNSDQQCIERISDMSVAFINLNMFT